MPAASSSAAAPSASSPPVAEPAVRKPSEAGLQTPPRHLGRRYGFLCGYCSSRLEATDNMAGQSGTCPTCGNTIVIPIFDQRGRLIDPASGQIIKQDPHPVHAYAAAGAKAPQIVAMEGSDERQIRCPRCNRLNPISANNCLGCGLPFTMEGTVGDTISGTNTWAVASLVLGIIGLPGFFCLTIPPLLAIIFGVIALKGSSQSAGTSSSGGQGIAIAGIVMGAVGVVLFALWACSMIR